MGSTNTGCKQTPLSYHQAVQGLSGKILDDQSHPLNHLRDLISLIIITFEARLLNTFW